MVLVLMGYNIVMAKKGTNYPTKKLFDLLSTVYSFRYLRSHFLYELVDSPLLGVREQITRRKKQGLIEEPKKHTRSYLSFFDHRILGITPKGVEYMRRMDAAGIAGEQVTKVPELDPDYEARDFPHTMMVCDTLASINIGFKALPDYRFIPWTEIVARSDNQHPLRWPYQVTHKGQSKEATMIGDGLFGFQRPNGKATFYVVEAERMSPKNPNTLSRSSTKLKILAYNNIISNKGYLMSGAKNMKVLFVFPTDARAKAAAELAEELVGPSNRFRFTAIPTQFEQVKEPTPFPHIVTDPLYRAGMESIPLIA